MGSSASKTNNNNETEIEKSQSRRPTSNAISDQQSETQSADNAEKLAEKEETWEKNENKIDNIHDREKGDDSDETNKTHTDGSERTGEGTDSGVVHVGNCMSISLPQNPTEHLDVDKRSANQINEDRKAKQEEEESAVKEKKDKEKKEEIEKGKVILKSKISSLKDRYAESEMKYSLLKKAVMIMNRYQQKLDSTGKEPFDLVQDEQKPSKLRTVRQEKGNLLHRLSEIASARLRHNNPDIADLSDENRATKLAERLSELYDNEWTDLFEATKHQAGKKANEQTIAEGLRDILKVCYEHCQKVAESQFNNLLSCLHMNISKELPAPLPAPPAELRLRIKEFQKNTSNLSFTHAQNIATGIVKSPSSLTFPKENVVVTHRSSSKTKDKYNKYVNMCTEITWYMQIQDPPLVLDFGTGTRETSRFRPYTISGPQLDYVLWPAMLLHDNGAVVSKGVAQFKKELKNEKISEERDKDNEKPNSKQFELAESDWS